jgi:hypothetical protein
MLKKQRGYSVLGIVFWGGLLAFALFFAIKVIPAYLEHEQIKHALESLKDIPDVKHMSKPRIQDKLLRNFQINSIKNASHQALEMEKDGGDMKLIFSYEVRAHMFANIDIVTKFHEEVMIE